ncbi:hypothetical protein BGW37DRAFT_554828 [Umbelopsis sp. PMI_123]|nr:hypothetical protein BGW37DRAFT_554828 [Umbelopsis sp. PMI_123]
MDDVENTESLEEVSLDSSISSDNQSELGVQASAATRWLSDRFHINTMPPKTEEDVFDVNQWPSFAPITTSVGINKQRFLFSSPIARSMSQKQQHEEIAESDTKDQGVTKDDVDMVECDTTKTSFIEPDPASPGQDTVMEEVYQDDLLTDNLYQIIKPSSPKPVSVGNNEMEASCSTSHKTKIQDHKTNEAISDKVKAGSGAVKGNSTQKVAKVQSNLTPFRRMIPGATKKSTSTSEKQEEDSDEVEGITRFAPITLQEKRRRQAKRAEQLKFWRVREEREAREARRAGRRELLEGRSGNAKRGGSAEPTAGASATLRKVVKFNLKRNRVIQFDDREANDETS